MVRRLSWTLAAAVPLAFLGVFFAWPVATLIGRGFFPDGVFSLAGFEAVFAAPRTWRVIGTTLAQAFFGTLAAVAVGVPGAWLLYRTRFPGRWLVRALVTVPFVLPSVVVGVAFKSLVISTGPLAGLGLDGSFVLIVASLVFFNYAVVVRTVGALWAALDPRTAQAAAVLGASPARVWWTVTLPALAPAIASAAALVFLFCASAYGVVMVLGGAGYGTIETEIWFLTSQLLDLRGAAALSVTQLVIVAVALWATGRAQVSLTRALKLQPDVGAARRYDARRDLPALAATLATALLLLGLPIANLVWRSLHRGGALTLANYSELATATVQGASPWRALGTSLTTALAATAIAVPLGVLVALVASRRPRRPSARRALAAVEAAYLLPLGVSAVTVGFGYLITLNRPPLDLRSSLILIPIAQAVVALPLVVRSLLPTLRAVDPRQLEAAATLGSPPWSVLARIELPHLTRGLGLAVGFAFATSLGEFGATSFLARPDNPTLPVLVVRLFGRPGAESYGLALAATVVLAGLAGAAMALAERARPEEVTAW